MAEPKAFASLSSGLLARKGAARPAMRRQGFGPLVAQAVPHEDLGWDDMGYDVDPPHDFKPHEGESMHHGSLMAGAIPQSHQPIQYPSEEQEIDLEDVPPVVRERHELAERLTSSPVDGIDGEVADLQEVPAVPVLKTRQRDAVKQPPIKHTPISAAKIDEIARVASADVSGKRAAFTLRVDPERHLRLRLACAISGRSAQQLVTAALDSYLDSLPQVGELASKVNGAAR